MKVTRSSRARRVLFDFSLFLRMPPLDRRWRPVCDRFLTSGHLRAVSYAKAAKAIGWVSPRDSGRVHTFAAQPQKNIALSACACRPQSLLKNRGRRREPSRSGIVSNGGSRCCFREYLSTAMKELRTQEEFVSVCDRLQSSRTRLREQQPRIQHFVQDTCPKSAIAALWRRHDRRSARIYLALISARNQSFLILGPSAPERFCHSHIVPPRRGTRHAAYAPNN